MSGYSRAERQRRRAQAERLDLRRRQYIRDLEEKNRQAKRLAERRKTNEQRALEARERGFNTNWSGANEERARRAMGQKRRSKPSANSRTGRQLKDVVPLPAKTHAPRRRRSRWGQPGPGQGDAQGLFIRAQDGRRLAVLSEDASAPTDNVDDPINEEDDLYSSDEDFESGGSSGSDGGDRDAGPSQIPSPSTVGAVRGDGDATHGPPLGRGTFLERCESPVQRRTRGGDTRREDTRGGDTRREDTRRGDTRRGDTMRGRAASAFVDAINSTASPRRSATTGSFRNSLFSSFGSGIFPDSDDEAGVADLAAPTRQTRDTSIARAEDVVGAIRALQRDMGLRRADATALVRRSLRRSLRVETSARPVRRSTQRASSSRASPLRASSSRASPLRASSSRASMSRASTSRASTSSPTAPSTPRTSSLVAALRDMRKSRQRALLDALQALDAEGPEPEEGPDAAPRPARSPSRRSRAHARDDRRTRLSAEGLSLLGEATATTPRAVPPGGK
jgi:hypothetical protein